jgi:hypothetical protein
MITVHRLRSHLHPHPSSWRWHRLGGNTGRQPPRRRKWTDHGRYRLPGRHDGHLHHPHHRFRFPSRPQQAQQSAHHRNARSLGKQEIPVLPRMLRPGFHDHLHSMRVPVRTYSSLISNHTLLTRINSLPEMAGGWGGELMRRESEFMVLDGMMTVIAAICLTVAHPGIYFPTISSKNRPATVEEQATANEKTSSMSSGQDEPAMAERA